MDLQEELVALKADSYRGIARIPLDFLNFDNTITRKKHRTLSPRNVSRIRGIFTRVGCNRQDAANFINGVVTESDLEDALRSTQANAQQLLSFREGDKLPLLKLRVECLSGLHRAEAGKSFLSDNDQWWIVRLFNKDAPETVLSRIVEHYTNEQRPSDGTIFWKIRYYHKNRDFDSENQWWAFLDKSKPKDLRQLLKSWSLTDAFDSLLDMPGLWDRLQLGALHRLLALKCEEEMVFYLQHVRETWLRIFEGTDLDHSVVDSSTAQKLELLCPKFTVDRKEIENLFDKSEIFPTVLDEDDRNTLKVNIFGLTTLIPTIWTFFETLKYLEPMCESLKYMLGDRLRGSIRRSFMGCYFQPEKTFLQTRLGHKVQLLSSHDTKQLAYTELWTFCARHFDELTTFTPKKQKGASKPCIKGPNPILRQRLAQLAASLGFTTPTIKEELDRDSHKNLAIEYLHKTNPMSTMFSESQIQRVVTASCYGLSETDSEEVDFEPLTQDRRCGRPFVIDSGIDKKVLFLPKLFREDASEGINLAYARKDLFQCLFGSFNLDTGPEIPDLPLNTTTPFGDATDSPNKKRRLDREPEGPLQSLQQQIGKLQRENKGLRKRNADLIRQMDNSSQTHQTYPQLSPFSQLPQTQFEPQLQNRENTAQMLPEDNHDSHTNPTQVPLESDRDMVDQPDIKLKVTRYSSSTDSWIVETATDRSVESDAISIMQGEDMISKMIQLDHVTRCSAFTQHLEPWYELFYVVRLEHNTTKHGISFAISNDEVIGLRQLRVIVESLQTAQTTQNETLSNYRGVTRAGTTIVGLEAGSIYDGCRTHKRVFIGLSEIMLDIMPSDSTEDDEW